MQRAQGVGTKLQEDPLVRCALERERMVWPTMFQMDKQGMNFTNFDHILPTGQNVYYMFIACKIKRVQCTKESLSNTNKEASLRLS